MNTSEEYKWAKRVVALAVVILVFLYLVLLFTAPMAGLIVGAIVLAIALGFGVIWALIVIADEKDW